MVLPAWREMAQCNTMLWPMAMSFNFSHLQHNSARRVARHVAIMCTPLTLSIVKTVTIDLKFACLTSRKVVIAHVQYVSDRIQYM
jgi:hypothetical protein